MCSSGFQGDRCEFAVSTNANGDNGLPSSTIGGIAAAGTVVIVFLAFKIYRYFHLRKRFHIFISCGSGGAVG